MEESEILRILMTDKEISQVFGGLYARDRFPSMQKGRLYLVNTAKHDDPVGEHYLIVERGLVSPNMISFACSYATNPKKYPIIYTKMRDTGCRITRLHKPLQKIRNDKLTNCSSFALFFSYHLARGIGLREMERRYFANVNLYKLNIFIVVTIRALFKLKTSVEKLLFDKNFVESLEKNKK